MKDASFRITLDINDSNSQISLPIRRADINRTIYVSLTEEGCPVNLADCFATCSAKLENGSDKLTATCSTNLANNNFELIIPPGMSQNKGMWECSLDVYNSQNEGHIGTPRFNVVVDDRIFNLTDEEAGEAGYTTDLLDAVAGAAANATLAANNAAKCALNAQVAINNVDTKLQGIEAEVNERFDTVEENIRKEANEQISDLQHIAEGFAGWIGIFNEWDGDEETRQNNESIRIANEKERIAADNERRKWVAPVIEKTIENWLDETVSDGGLSSIDFNRVTPQMFGAVGDGVADDSQAFWDMIHNSPDGTRFVIPKGEYIIDTHKKNGSTYIYKDGYFRTPMVIKGRNDLTFEFEPGAIIRSKIQAPEEDGKASAIICIGAKNGVPSKNIRIIGGEFIGEFCSRLDATGVPEHYGILIEKSSDIHIENVVCREFLAACITVGSSSNVTVKNTIAHTSRYHGMVIENSSNVVVDNCSSWGAYGNSWCCSLDIEGLYGETAEDETSFNKDIHIINSRFGASEGPSISVNKSIGVILRGCEIGVGNNTAFNLLGIVKNVAIDSCKIIGKILATVTNTNKGEPLGLRCKNIVFSNCEMNNVMVSLIATQTISGEGLLPTDFQMCFQNNRFKTSNTPYNSVLNFKISQGKADILFKGNVFETETKDVSVLLCDNGQNHEADIKFDSNALIWGRELPIDGFASNQYAWSIDGSKISFANNMVCFSFSDVFSASAPYLFKVEDTIPPENTTSNYAPCSIMKFANNHFILNVPNENYKPVLIKSHYASMDFTHNKVEINGASPYVIYDKFRDTATGNVNIFNEARNVYAYNAFVGRDAKALVKGAIITDTSDTNKDIKQNNLVWKST